MTTSPVTSDATLPAEGRQTAPVHTEAVTPDADPVAAASPAVRAAMRIALRNGCALSREAAEQITEAVLGCAGEIVTQYGCRYDEEFVQRVHDEAMARKIARAGKSLGHVPVSRQMVIGPWEELSGDC